MEPVNSAVETLPDNNLPGIENGAVKGMIDVAIAVFPGVGNVAGRYAK